MDSRVSSGGGQGDLTKDRRLLDPEQGVFHDQPDVGVKVDLGGVVDDGLDPFDQVVRVQAPDVIQEWPDGEGGFTVGSGFEPLAEAEGEEREFLPGGPPRGAGVFDLGDLLQDGVEISLENLLLELFCLLEQFVNFRGECRRGTGGALGLGCPVSRPKNLWLSPPCLLPWCFLNQHYSLRCSLVSSFERVLRYWQR